MLPVTVNIDNCVVLVIVLLPWTWFQPTSNPPSPPPPLYCFILTGVLHISFAGIIENDDIQLVNSEIERALNFSRKCSMLVDAVKKKYKNRYVSTQWLVM